MSQVWFVTGSSRGLGREIARAALVHGNRVVATARNPADLQPLVDEFGDRVRTLALDVTDSDAAKRAMADAVSTFGRIDVVVNNAGYANVNAFEDLPEDDFRAQIETNFFGVVNVTRAALPFMRRQRDGHIIQISSVGGRFTTPGLAAYQSAKFAVGGFSEVVAKEVAQLGIKVTVIEPGGMRTDWAGSSMRTDKIQADYEPTVGAMTRMVRGESYQDGVQSDPAKVAEAVVRIASEPRPPMRLLAGSDAVFIAAGVLRSREREDATWVELSRSTDFDGRPDFAETPTAKMIAGADLN